MKDFVLDPLSAMKGQFIKIQTREREMNQDQNSQDYQDYEGNDDAVVGEENKSFEVFKADQASTDSVFFEELFSLNSFLLLLSLPLVIPALTWMWLTAKRWGRILWIDWLISGAFILFFALIYDRTVGGPPLFFPILILSALSGSIYQVRKGDKLAGMAALGLMMGFAMVWGLDFIGVNFLSYGGMAGHQKRVALLTLSENGRVLASTERGGKVYFWSSESETFLKQRQVGAKDIFRMALNADGSKLLAYSNGPGMSYLDLSTGDVLWKEKNFGGSLSDLKILSGGEMAVFAKFRGELELWDLEAGESAGTLGNHEGSVNCIAVSGDGQRVISGGNNRLAKVWDINNAGDTVAVLQHKKKVEVLALSKNGDKALTAVSGGRLHYWVLGENNSVELKTNGTIRDLAFSEDSRRAYILTDLNYEVWDLASKSLSDASRFGMTKPSKNMALGTKGRVYIGVGKTIRIYSQ